jgi:hypothetical protein
LTTKAHKTLKSIRVYQRKKIWKLLECKMR